jgi:hypothetical protein
MISRSAYQEIDMNSRQRVTRRLKLENLENRTMLAGDVAVSVVQGNLKIEGDIQANEIAVTDLGGGQVEVAGQNGTTINGQAGPLTFASVLRSVKIELKEGDDVVRFTGNNQNSLKGVAIETGAGADTVSVDDVFARYLKVETGSDNDIVNVLDASAKEVKIETGRGNDTVNLGNTSLQSDATVQAHELKIETGGGNDIVQIQDAVLQTHEAKIETGSGDDTVTVQDLQAQGSFQAETGSGTDSVAISDSLFAKLGVEAGSEDNDLVSILNTTALRTKLDGGRGLGDTLSIAGSSLGTTKTRGFEVIV